MYSKSELEAKAHIELINIAKELGIPRATRMDAQELIYKIIGLQSENPNAITKEQENQKAKEPESRPRLCIKPTLLAESSLNNPELHKKKIREPQARNNGKNIDSIKEGLHSIQTEMPGINIADLELPLVPTIPDVVSPSGGCCAARRVPSQPQKRRLPPKRKRPRLPLPPKWQQSLWSRLSPSR